jgi:hypothetical protein
MKKLNIVILIILSAFTQTLKSQTTDKNVFWLHGLTGKKEMMSILAGKYQSERKMQSSSFTYVTDGGVTGSSIEINSRLWDVGQGGSRLYDYTGPNTIFIAQSMGGMNARELARTHPDHTYYGGLITMGSTELGAYIANNISSGIYDQLKSDIPGKGLKGALLELDPVLMNTSNFVLSVLGIFIQPRFDLVVSDLTSKVLDDRMAIQFGTPLTRSQMKVTSPELQRLQSYNQNIPEIAIWGNENAPAFLRCASSRLDGEETNFQGVPGQLNDDRLVKLVDQAGDISNTMATLHDVNYWVQIACLNFPVAALEKYKRDKWNESKDFWQNGIQKSTDALIGATRTEFQGIWGWYLQCPGGDDSQNKGINPHPCAPEDMIPVWGLRYFPVVITTESDGMALKNSAVALPGVGRIIEAPGVNHEELKNHDVMFGIFDQIFNATDPMYYDPRNKNFFKCDPR